MTKPTQKVLCIQLKGSQRFLRLLGDSSKIKGLRSGLVTLKPQELIGEHKTENKEELIKQADIIISGIGKGKYITGNMIKQGAILIDAGTSESDSGIIGDVDLESVKDIASFVSPVPGGVGPVTVAMLLNNVLSVAKSLAQARAFGSESQARRDDSTESYVK